MSAVIEGTAIGADRHLVTCRGELDLHAAPDLTERLMDVISAGGLHVAVDLTDVSFVDSTVMTVLVQRRKELVLRGGTMALVGVDPSVQMIFEIAGLDRAFPEYGTVEEAFAVVSEP